MANDDSKTKKEVPPLLVTQPVTRRLNSAKYQMQ